MALQIAPQLETVAAKLVTADELLAMGNIGRTELINGVIHYYMPTGHPHGFYEATITAMLHLYARKHKCGRALSGEVGIYIRRDPDTVRAVDAAFISNERLKKAKLKGYLDVAPELVVEVLSPDDTWRYVQEKLVDYFSADVLTIWVVDPKQKLVHVYQSLTDVTVLTEADVLSAENILPDFKLPIADIFSE